MRREAGVGRFRTSHRLRPLPIVARIALPRSAALSPAPSDSSPCDSRGATASGDPGPWRSGAETGCPPPAQGHRSLARSAPVIHGARGSIIHSEQAAGPPSARLRLPDKEKRMLVAAGAGAGFAAASTRRSPRCSRVEVITGSPRLDILMRSHRDGHLDDAHPPGARRGPLYGTQDFAGSQEELVAYCVLGAAAGFRGRGFSPARSLRGTNRQRGLCPHRARRARGRRSGRAATRCRSDGNGYEAIQSILDAPNAGAISGAPLVAKAGAPSPPSLRQSGGVFTPRCSWGAALGGLVGSACLTSL